MFYWILSAILWAVWDILYKKSLKISEWKISDKMYQFYWNILLLIFLPLFYIFFDFENLTLYTFILIFITSILSIVWELFEQYAYKNEKISVLLPYWEFQSIFTILIWFFVFSDNSLISFIFASLAWITLIIGSINFKNFKFNKYCLSITIWALLWSIKYVLYWLLLIHISEYSIMIFNTLIWAILLFVLVLKTEKINQYKKITKKITLFVFLENYTRLMVSLITLFLIKELWLVQAVLISMLYLVASLILSSIFFKNLPSKKEIIIVVIVFLFISLWSVFW